MGRRDNLVLSMSILGMGLSAKDEPFTTILRYMGLDKSIFVYMVSLQPWQLRITDK